MEPIKHTAATMLTFGKSANVMPTAQCVDAGGKREQQHGQERERIVDLVLLLRQCLADHAGTDEGEQHKGNPVIHGGDVLFKGGAEQITDRRHECLEAAEPQSDDEIMAQPQLFGGQPLADGYGERVHGQSDRDEE